jgi:hypothetical protein
MKCVHCHSDAEAICKYCGRAVCIACSKTGEYRSGAAVKLFPQLPKSALIVQNVIWCGICIVRKG